MLNKEEVGQVLAWIGGRAHFSLGITVDEAEAPKVMAKVKSAGFTGFLRQFSGSTYEIVVTGKLDGDS